MVSSEVRLLHALLNSASSYSVHDEQVFVFENFLQCVAYSIEAAGGSLLLREFRHTEVGLAAVLEDAVEVGMEVDWLYLKVCRVVSIIAGRRSRFDSQLQASTLPLTTSPPERLSQTTSRSPYLRHSRSVRTSSLRARPLPI